MDISETKVREEPRSDETFCVRVVAMGDEYFRYKDVTRSIQFG